MKDVKEKYFYDLVGQEDACEKLTYILDSQKKRGAVIPHLLFRGGKGDGKTRMASAMGRWIEDGDDPSKEHKDFFVINAASVNNVGTLVSDVLLPTQGMYCTFFFDEIHALNPRVVPALLTILEPNKRNRTSFVHEKQQLNFDFKKQTFMFATTEDHKVFHALKDRMHIVDVQPYTREELGEIVLAVLDGRVKIQDGLLEEISIYIRQNARKADEMAKFIMSAGAKKFGKPEWEKLKKAMKFLPLGLEKDELRILETLKKEGDMSLGMLASSLGRPVQAVRRDLEDYLKRRGLMTIDGKRRITDKGLNYLRKLAA